MHVSSCESHAATCLAYLITLRFTDAHIQVMCGRDYITVRALEDFFMYHNVPLESLHLSNKSCIAQREVIHGVPYYMLKTTKEKYLACGGKQLEVHLKHYLRYMPYTLFSLFSRKKMLVFLPHNVAFDAFSPPPSYRKTLLTSPIP